MTGDIGHFDGHGRLTVTDRKKDIFRFKSSVINPSEVEEVILKINGVAQVAVVGIPNPDSNALSAAAVVKKQGFENLTEQTILDYVAERVVWQLHLHGGVFFKDSLPMTTSGKILKRVILTEIVNQNLKSQ